MDRFQRIYPRIPLRVPIDYVDFERFLPDRMLNLSAGGAFVYTSNPLKLGEKMEVRFELPELRRLIHVRSKVTWIPGPNSKGAGIRHPFGMGIAFERFDKDTLALLDQYVTVEHALQTLDTRVGYELPYHILKALPTPLDPIFFGFSDADLY